MPMHASERLRNVKRTVLVNIIASLAAQNRGWPVVPDTDEKFDSTGTPAYVRVTFQEMPEERSGRVATLHAIRARIIVLADCFARGSASQPPQTIDTVEEMQECVAFALRYASMPLIDYVADPTGGTGVTGVAVRFHRPPEPRHAQRRVGDT